MRRAPALASLLLAVAAFAAGRATAPPVEMRADVLRAIDGDSLVVRPTRPLVERVRLRYVNASEHDQPGGPEATAALRAAVEGKRVTLLMAPSGKDGEVCRDDYGRLIAVVRAGRRDVALDLVARGLIRTWDRFERVPPEYAAAEAAAREAGLGIWHVERVREPAPATPGTLGAEMPVTR